MISIAILFGLLLVVYGAIKLTASILSFALPKQAKQRLHQRRDIGWMINTDDSVAGRVLMAFLMLLSVFTLVHGLSLLNVFHPAVKETVEGLPAQLPFNLFMGLSMTLFFALVLFTDVRIPKDPDHKQAYELLGLGGGLLFLATVPALLVFFKYWRPMSWRGFASPGAILLMVTSCVLGFGFVWIMLHTKHLTSDNLMSVLMIPLNLA